MENFELFLEQANKRQNLDNLKRIFISREYNIIDSLKMLDGIVNYF